jgi:hypothetical protein
MMPIKLLAALAATLMALPAAAQNPASAEKRTSAQESRTQASTPSAQLNQKQRRKLAKPCPAPSGKSAGAK